MIPKEIFFLIFELVFCIEGRDLHIRSVASNLNNTTISANQFGKTRVARSSVSSDEQVFVSSSKQSISVTDMNKSTHSAALFSDKLNLIRKLSTDTEFTKTSSNLHDRVLYTHKLFIDTDQPLNYTNSVSFQQRLDDTHIHRNIHESNGSNTSNGAMPFIMSGPETDTNNNIQSEITKVDNISNILPYTWNEAASRNAEEELVQIKLGDVTVTVCSQYLLCQNRCDPSVPYDSVDEHSVAKRQIDSDYHTPEKRNALVDTKRSYHNAKSGIEKREAKAVRMFRDQMQDTASRQDSAGQRWRRNAEAGMSGASCTNKLQNATCFCDEKCVIYGDCCVDVFQSCYARNRTHDILDLISDIKTKYDFTSRLADTALGTIDNIEISQEIVLNFILYFSSCEKIDLDRSVLLVSRCPTEFVDTDLRRNCEDPIMSSIPPVTAILPEGNITFRNVFCAQCHSIKTDVLQPWLVQLDCDNEVTDKPHHVLTITGLNNLVSSGECNVTFSVQPGTCEPRTCEPDFSLGSKEIKLLARSVQTGMCTQADATLCQTYYIPKNGFKNPNCELCLNYKQPRSWKGEVIDMCNVTYPFKHRNGNPLPEVGETGGILIILDITGLYTERHQGTTFYVCDDSEVFDPFILECKPLICSPGFEPYRGKCVQSTAAFIVARSSQIFPDGWGRLDVVTTTSETQSYISCDAVLNNTKVTTKHTSFLVEKIQINDYKEINGISPENSSTARCQCEEIITKEESEFLQTVDLILSLTHDVDLDTVYELVTLAESLIPLRSDNDAVQITITNMINKAQVLHSCTNDGIMAERSDFTLTQYKGILYAVFNLTQEGVYYPLNNIGYQFQIYAPTDSNSSLTLSNVVFICLVSEIFSRVDCSITVYWLNETQLNNTGLTLLASGQYYTERDFDIRGNQVYVCTNFSFKIQRELVKQSVTYLIVTCTLTMFSVMFLLLMLFLYCLLPELRTLPGKMTASLAGTMTLTFLANLFTMTELHHDYVCPIVAILSHVVTLSHFGWMSAIAVNMALTFGPRTNRLVKSQNDNKTFLIYNIIVWGISVALVTTSSILDFTHSEDRQIVTDLSHQEVTYVSVTKYPHYGYPFCTWFSGPLWTKLSFVIVPYFVTYIISTVGFILTLVGIHESCKNSEKFGIQSSEKTRCLIYIKLSTAMGFSWILSILVNIYPNVKALMYIYLCLVLLQGVLLFLAFMVNKKVYSLLVKNYFSKIKANSKDDTRISIVMTNTS